MSIFFDNKQCEMTWVGGDLSTAIYLQLFSNYLNSFTHVFTVIYIKFN